MSQMNEYKRRKEQRSLLSNKTQQKIGNAQEKKGNFYEIRIKFLFLQLFFSFLLLLMYL